MWPTAYPLYKQNLLWNSQTDKTHSLSQNEWEIPAHGQSPWKAELYPGKKTHTICKLAKAPEVLAWPTLFPHIRKISMSTGTPEIPHCRREQGSPPHACAAPCSHAPNTLQMQSAKSEKISAAEILL